jgi:undecaprenyl phosphate-alpha-L-ara4FN deformylase
MIAGLRIDVDTYRGTKYGVPNLVRLLEAHAVSASFFFSVGPDNMGRHLWRLMRPVFLRKMLRSNAASLYGWDILLKGTLWPGPVIGQKLADVIRLAAGAGHEVGLHAWDHHAWQVGIDSMSARDILLSLEQGFALLADIIGRSPTCSAVPGWRCNDLALLQKTRFPFRYNSDCRGDSIFLPLVDETPLSQPQIPVTLPTYDEVIGRDGIDNNNYNDYLLSRFKPSGLNVLAVHAEVEGMACLDMFARFLRMARSKGIFFAPLKTLLDRPHAPAKHASLLKKLLPGRQGWVSHQATIAEQAETMP